LNKAPLDTDITDNSNLIELRRTYLLEAIKAADYPEIERILLHVIDKQPDRVQEKIELVDHSFNHGHDDKAVEYFKLIKGFISKRDSDVPASIYTSLIRINLRLKRYEAATKIASLFIPLFEKDSRMALFSMRAFNEVGDQEKLLVAARSVSFLCRDNYNYLAEMAFLLNNKSMAHMVIDFLEGVDVKTCSNFDLTLQYGRALARISPTSPKTIEILEEAHKLGGYQQKSATMLSKLYLKNAQNRLALEIFDSTGIEQQPESARAQYADALMANGKPKEASKLYFQLVQDNPNHDGWLRSCISAFLLAGEEETARKIYKDSINLNGLSAYSSFSEALAAIDGNLSAAKIPEFRFDWAYDKLKLLGCEPEDRSVWEEGCRWVNLADHLMLKWLEVRPQDADDLLSLISGAEECREILEYHTRSGMGAFIATAHVGGLFAGPLALAKSGLNYRWVASTPVVSDTPGAEFLLSTFSQNKLRLAKKIMGAVKRKAVVSIAIDGSKSVSAKSVPFLDDTILLSDFIPRAIFQTGARSFFPKVLWQDNKISIKLSPLPMPGPTDTLDDFISIWFDDFIKNLTEIFIESPQNLRMSGGFWNDVTL